MANITPDALKNLLKGKINAIDFSSGELQNDDLLLAFAESIAIAAADNTVFATPIQNGGNGESAVYLIGSFPTLAWNSAPTGTYSAVDLDFTATTRFGIRTDGTWYVSGVGDESIPSAAGEWRGDGVEDTLLYEVRITSSSPSNTQTTGDATDDGSWFTLTQESTIYITDFNAGTKSSNVTVEIRNRFDTPNTTGVASFTMSADGDTGIGGGGGPIP